MLAWPFLGKCLTHPAAIHLFFYDHTKENEQKAKDHLLSEMTKFRKAEKKFFLIFNSILLVFKKPLIYYGSLDIYMV